MPRTYVQWGDWEKLNLKKAKGKYEPKTDEEKKAFADDCREKVWPQLNELYGEEFLTELLADIQANT